MRLIFEGCGFGEAIEVETTNHGTTVLEALFAQYPEKRRIPWNKLWLSYNGKNLAAKDSVETLPDGIRIRVSGRLCGGGGDGGSTGAESRDAYLAMYRLPKADKVDENEERLAKWTCCQLSGDALTPPCVCDPLGTLFNKEAVIKALIDKTMPQSLAHIVSLRHVISLKLMPKPATTTTQAKAVKDAQNYQSVKETEIKFHCPITNLEMNGNFRFLVHVQTGWVISARALKEAKKAVDEIVGMKSSLEDWLLLNGTSEEVQALRSKLLIGRSRRSKKSKKRQPPVKERSSPETKKSRVLDHAPEQASKSVYASIFSSSDDREGETYLCRSVAARGMNLT